MKTLAERNSYAHVWRTIKDTFGMTYKEIPDALFEQVIDTIEWCKNNPK